MGCFVSIISTWPTSFDKFLEEQRLDQSSGILPLFYLFLMSEVKMFSGMLLIVWCDHTQSLHSLSTRLQSSLLIINHLIRPHPAPLSPRFGQNNQTDNFPLDMDRWWEKPSPVRDCCLSHPTHANNPEAATFTFTVTVIDLPRPHLSCGWIMSSWILCSPIFTSEKLTSRY